MAWDDAWAVSIVTVDSQMHEAMRNRQIAAALNHVLSSLVNYTKVHFAAEEDLLRKAACPDFPAHKVEHERFAGASWTFRKT